MEQLSDRESRSIEGTSANMGRRVYVAPHLLEYGSVAKLTQGSNGSVSDGGGSMPTQKKASSYPGNAPAKMR